jgi:hypothetical protein
MHFAYGAGFCSLLIGGTARRDPAVNDTGIYERGLLDHGVAPADGNGIEPVHGRLTQPIDVGSPFDYETCLSAPCVNPGNPGLAGGVVAEAGAPRARVFLPACPSDACHFVC